jgi:asparagine synthase (glutamine-hydrolysing)
MIILLSKFQWHTRNGIHVTGFIREGDRYLRNQELIDYFSGTDSIETFGNKLRSANGQFSVIIKSEDNIWAGTDRFRNYPLFYTRINEEFFISDSCYTLTDKLSVKRLNTIAADCFLAAGYTVNNLTLINGIYQVEAGEYITERELFSRKFYYDSATIPVIKRDFEILSEELYVLFFKVFKNHFKALNDKFIVIPLSGGFDSRLIASMCSVFHPENVLCYTYGIENNCEVDNAKEVAGRLGFKWINILYNSQLIDGYLDDDVFRQYYPYVSELSSMFFMQEYFAVKYLKENNLIPENSVFMPGFCGDVLAGCNLTPAMNKLASGEQIAGVIYNEFFRLTKPDSLKAVEIINQISSKLSDDKSLIWKAFESWDHKEPKAKFNVNSSKVFLFFGYEFVLPLWDSELEDFFAAIPFQFKLNKKLYDHVLRRVVFKKHNLNFPKELNPLPVQKSVQRVKEKIKDIIPAKIKDLFIKHKSQIFYDEITRLMITDIGSENITPPRQSSYYNSYITQWYLNKTREYLNNK